MYIHGVWFLNFLINQKNVFHGFILNESYESVFEGLSLNLSISSLNCTYRVGSTELSLTAVPDSSVYGSSSIGKTNRKTSFRFFKMKTEEKNEFLLILKYTIS